LFVCSSVFNFLEGRLPIHLACEYDAHASAIDILVAADPQTLYVHDPNTYTALDFLKSRPDVSLSSQKESETASQMSYDFSILTPGYSSGNKVRSEDSFRKIWNSTKTSTLPHVNRTCSFSTLSSNSSFPERSSFSCTEETGESSHSREEEECIEVGLVGGSDHIVAEDKDTESLRISRYWRDIIHGSFTGLLGAFALVTLFAGESLTVNETFIYGMTGTLAGSFLVGVSEFLATKSQNFVNFEKVKAEASLIRVNKEDEIFKLHRLFDKIGISDIKLQNLLTQFYANNDENLLQVISLVGLGISSECERSPLHAAFFSSATFVIGASITLLPFAFAQVELHAITFSFILTLLSVINISFFMVGHVDKHFLDVTLQNLGIVTLGGSGAYLCGMLFKSIQSS